ncbi:MAG TPA: DPP IV N-terminal domain-containing protein, partial [Flavisolibacter sp.]|nr:DPP IV N-terminal domain-containing protein [Flavisolibacter sp.]
YNQSKTAYAYAKNGDVYYADAKTNKAHRVTQTAETESSPQFIDGDSKLVYARAQNLYAWEIATGLTIQLTNFQRGTAPKEAVQNTQEKWLQQEAISLSDVVRERKQKRDTTEALNKRLRPKEPRPIYLDDKNLFAPAISADGKFVLYRLTKQAANAKNTVIPNYVTETGFTTDINGRNKVGAPLGSTELYLYDTEKDTAYAVKTANLPGITDRPEYTKQYASTDTARKKPGSRTVSFMSTKWNEAGTKAVVDIRSTDNKDRWMALLDPATGNLKTLDRQHDSAWIAGPGIPGYDFPTAAPLFWLDHNTIVFQSEATGYSHLYKINVESGEKTQLTAGQFEVSNLQLSKDKKTLYFNTNETHPGDLQYYRMPVNG